jgi:hypothetical protein
MKRQGKVINAHKVRIGRTLARWAQAGMNWAECPEREALMANGRRIAANPVACVALYEFVYMLMIERGTHVATQSVVTDAVNNIAA